LTHQRVESERSDADAVALTEDTYRSIYRLNEVGGTNVTIGVRRMSCAPCSEIQSVKVCDSTRGRSTARGNSGSRIGCGNGTAIVHDRATLDEGLFMFIAFHLFRTNRRQRTDVAIKG